MDLKLTPSSSLPLFLINYRLGRGHEETTNQARRRRGTPRETPTTSSLVATMSVEELRLYNQIPINISLKTSNDAATSTIGEAGNVVYFTREQFATGWVVVC